MHMTHIWITVTNRMISTRTDSNKVILQNVGKCTVNPVHIAVNPQVNGFIITLGTFLRVYV